MLELIEIKKVAVQGFTKPFLCTGDDGKDYYAKGQGATASGLIKEWLAAHLAKNFGLPIPNFHIAYINSLLVESYGQDALASLGQGKLFVSEKVESATDFKYHLLNQVDKKLQSDILFFDLWIENADRTLTQYGGNPNLLWGSGEQKLHIIDHNLAFDAEFNLQDFKETHVCHAHFSTSQLDILDKQALEQRLQNSLLSWSQAWDTIPDDWKAQNEDSKIFDVDVTFQRLQSEAQGGIWSKWL
jgi:hypothetical protein